MSNFQLEPSTFLNSTHNLSFFLNTTVLKKGEEEEDYPYFWIYLFFVLVIICACVCPTNYQGSTQLPVRSPLPLPPLLPLSQLPPPPPYYPKK